MSESATSFKGIQGILETPVYVEDFEQAHAFYGGVLGLERILTGDRLWVYEVKPDQVLLIFKRDDCREDVPTPGGIVPGHGTTGPSHFAFAISKSDLDHWRTHLQENSIRIVSEVKWSAGGTSLYFNDPDENVVELATKGLWPGY